MLAELPPGGHIIQGGLRVQEQDQFGPIDLRLGGGGAADQRLAGRHLVGGEGRLVGGGGTGHRDILLLTHPLSHIAPIPTSDCETEH